MSRNTAADADLLALLRTQVAAAGGVRAWARAKTISAGFDVKALRQIIRMRTWEPARLEEHEALVDVYRRALGM